MTRRIPYGYCIVDGKAQIQPEEAANLKVFFNRFLSGETMSAAAKEAHIPYAPSSYSHLFTKKEYVGTEFYPAVITPEFQGKLIQEYEKRKKESRRGVHRNIRREVVIYKDFRLARKKKEDPADPAAAAEALYQRIKPIKYADHQ